MRQEKAVILFGRRAFSSDYIFKHRNTSTPSSSSKQNKNHHRVNMSQPYGLFSYRDAELLDQLAEFRVMELLPSRRGPEVSCRIIVDKIAQPARYKALSYAWGRESAACSMLVLPSKSDSCGDSCDTAEPTVIPITKSLHSALVDLRRPSKPFRIWIDQICINQKDEIEKAAQVRLMEPIYTKAAQVVVWLGPAADDSDAVMDVWQSVGQLAKDWGGLEYYFPPDQLPLLSGILQNSEVLRTAAGQFVPVIKSEAVGHWFRRVWFTRA
jgi:hypothetical protein